MSLFDRTLKSSSSRSRSSKDLNEEADLNVFEADSFLNSFYAAAESILFDSSSSLTLSLLLGS